MKTSSVEPVRRQRPWWVIVGIAFAVTIAVAGLLLIAAFILLYVLWATSGSNK